jgi:hypothetical protein
MKTPRRGATHRVMSPMEFLARLAILVPPPHFPLTRYHGVFAARSSGAPSSRPSLEPRDRAPCKKRPSKPPPAPTPTTPPAPAPANATNSPHVVAEDGPTTCTPEHWGRLLDGALYATGSRLDWALLLRRTHGIDSLACPGCGARLRPIATLRDPEVVRAILEHLGRPIEPPRRARARDPTGQESLDFHAASGLPRR